MMSLFKESYGVTVNAYLNHARVNYIKQQLRFIEKTVETLAAELDIEPAYLSWLFKKIEGIPLVSFGSSGVVFKIEAKPERLHEVMRRIKILTSC